MLRGRRMKHDFSLRHAKGVLALAAALKSRLVQALAITLLAGVVQAAYAQQVAPAPGATVDLTILAINDFHGNLKPPDGGIVVADAAGGVRRVAAGGAEHLATLVENLRAS